MTDMMMVIMGDKITKESAETTVVREYDTCSLLVETLMRQHPSLTSEEAMIFVITYSDDTFISQPPAETQILQSDACSPIGSYYRSTIKVLGRKHSTLTMRDWFAIMKYNYAVSLRVS